MIDMYEIIRDNLHFNKFVVGELLFVEYKCPIEQDVAGVWTPTDYFVQVVSGTKTWRAAEGDGRYKMIFSRAKPTPPSASSPRRWKSPAARVFIVASASSGCSATFRRHVITRCRKASR